MKTHKLKNLHIIPPKKTSGEYETSQDLPKMHQVCIAVGKRASGKSTAVVNLIEQMKFDYVIAVSPTIKSNNELMDRLKIKHVFEDCDNPNIVDDIKSIINDEAAALERYREELKRYDKLIYSLHQGNVFVNDSDLISFFNGNDFVKPKHEWNNRKPRIAVLFDDCMGSVLYSKPRKLNALSTYSRHIGQMKEGGSIGVSLFFLIQSFKAQSGGLNKVIRNQCTSMLLFKTKDITELNDVAESVAGEIDRETFFKVYDKAIGDGKSHEFLFIDLHRKQDHPSMFRKYFNEFILV